MSRMLFTSNSWPVGSLMLITSPAKKCCQWQSRQNTSPSTIRQCFTFMLPQHNHRLVCVCRHTVHIGVSLWSCCLLLRLLWLCLTLYSFCLDLLLFLLLFWRVFSTSTWWWHLFEHTHFFSIWMSINIVIITLLALDGSNFVMILQQQHYLTAGHRDGGRCHGNRSRRSLHRVW